MRIIPKQQRRMAVALIHGLCLALLGTRLIDTYGQARGRPQHIALQAASRCQGPAPVRPASARPRRIWSEGSRRRGREGAKAPRRQGAKAPRRQDTHAAPGSGSPSARTGRVRDRDGDERSARKYKADAWREAAAIRVTALTHAPRARRRVLSNSVEPLPPHPAGRSRI